MKLDPATATAAFRVFEWLDELVGGLPVPTRHRELLALHVEEGRAQASAVRLTAMEVPLLVHGAIADDEAAALPLAGACALVYLGADLLDNVADDELPARWHGRSAAEATLAAATLLAALPALALEQLDTPADRLRRVQRELAEGLLAMSAGQHEDLVPPQPWDLASCRRMVERKGGGEFAGFCRAAAVLAGANDEVVDVYGEVGAALGAGQQIGSDLGDLGVPGASRDLVAGRRTLPIVHALGTLEGAERASLERLLAAFPSAAGRAELRELLAKARSPQYVALVVEVYVRRALRMLDAAAPREPAGSELRALVAGVSLFSPAAAAER